MKGKKKWKRTTAERRQTNNKETWRIDNNQISECNNYTYQHNIGVTYILVFFIRVRQCLLHRMQLQFVVMQSNN